MKGRILIADDEESVRYTFSSFLGDAGYIVCAVSTLYDCMEKLKVETFDLIFLDIKFGSENGLDALREIKSRSLNCPVVMITGNPNPETIIEARRCGAVDYLAKPVREASLLYITEKTLSQNSRP